MSHSKRNTTKDTSLTTFPLFWKKRFFYPKDVLIKVYLRSLTFKGLWIPFLKKPQEDLKLSLTNLHDFLIWKPTQKATCKEHNLLNARSEAGDLTVEKKVIWFNQLLCVQSTSFIWVQFLLWIIWLSKILISLPPPLRKTYISHLFIQWRSRKASGCPIYHLFQQQCCLPEFFVTHGNKSHSFIRLRNLKKSVIPEVPYTYSTDDSHWVCGNNCIFLTLQTSFFFFVNHITFSSRTSPFSSYQFGFITHTTICRHVWWRHMLDIKHSEINCTCKILSLFSSRWAGLSDGTFTHILGHLHQKLWASSATSQQCWSLASLKHLGS